MVSLGPANPLYVITPGEGTVLPTTESLRQLGVHVEGRPLQEMTAYLNGNQVTIIKGAYRQLSVQPAPTVIDDVL